MTDKTIKSLHAASFLLIFIAFFYSYLLTPLWDYDFWWHIATGRYIATEGHLPETDPFSYTSTMPENKNMFLEREKVFLKQYWLAQVIYYLVFIKFGAGGVVFARSFLLTLIVLTVFAGLKRSRLQPYLIFIFAVLLYMVSLRALGERPVLFSMLFTAVVLFALEEFKERRNRWLYLLLPTMLIWANMHGAFVIGNLLIGIYMFSEALKLAFKRSTLSQQERVLFFSVTALAIVISYLNPTGWSAFLMSFDRKYDIFQAGIQEYVSPITAYTKKVAGIDYAYFTFALLFPVILVLRNRKIDLAHFLVLLGFLSMSLKAGRFTFFYSIVASMILAKEFGYVIDGLIEKRITSEKYRKVSMVFAVATLLSSLLFIYSIIQARTPRFDVARRYSIPEEAVDFIQKNDLTGRMFNDFGYGGYITWRLYPIRTFIDSRTLNYSVMNEYGWVTDAARKVEGIRTANEDRPVWEAVLRHYKINYVFLSLNDVFGNIWPVILELTASDEWVPIYIDRMSIIFMKNIPENSSLISKFRIEDEFIYNVLIYRLASMNTRDTVNPRYLSSLGFIFSKLGRHEDAVKAYRLAAERWGDPDVMKKIQEIDAMMDQQGSKNSKEDRVPQKKKQ